MPSRSGVVDITDRDALAGALPDISGVGAVVNAAGICPPTTLADYDDETYRRVFDVNVLGTLNVIVWKLAQGTSMTGQTIVIAGGLIVR
jgi:NADP-dependent 3-hydroxy acid dehydrogenase YdfG